MVHGERLGGLVGGPDVVFASSSGRWCTWTRTCRIGRGGRGWAAEEIQLWGKESVERRTRSQAQETRQRELKVIVVNRSTFSPGWPINCCSCASMSYMLSTVRAEMPGIGGSDFDDAGLAGTSDAGISVVLDTDVNMSCSLDMLYTQTHTAMETQISGLMLMRCRCWRSTPRLKNRQSQPSPPAIF